LQLNAEAYRHRERRALTSSFFLIDYPNLLLPALAHVGKSPLVRLVLHYLGVQGEIALINELYIASNTSVSFHTTAMAAAAAAASQS